MEDAQGTQYLDELQFADIEIAELAVGLDDFRQLELLLFPVAGKQHPQILHRRGHAAVVEVDEVRSAVAPQQVAGVAVAMHAQVLHIPAGVEALFQNRQQVAGEAVVGKLQLGRDEMAADEIDAVDGMALQVDARTMAKGLLLADAVDARQQAADDGKIVLVVQLRRTAAATGKQAETMVAEGVQSLLALVDERGHHRQFLFQQFSTEGMLFEDLRVAPATRAIELGDQRVAVFDADLINAVLVGVEGQDAAIAAMAQGLDRVHDEVRRQVLEGMWVPRWIAHQCPASWCSSSRMLSTSCRPWTPMPRDRLAGSRSPSIRRRRMPPS